jgi:5-methylcytosine-specific restriction endonuclease McrA
MRRRNTFHYGTTWRKVRRVVLDRDNYRCTIGLPGCGKVATQVDHVVPLAFGGAPFQLARRLQVMQRHAREHAPPQTQPPLVTRVFSRRALTIPSSPLSICP